MRVIGYLETSGTDYKGHGVVKNVIVGQKKGILLWEIKTVRCRTSLCFVIIAVRLLQIR